MSSTVSKLNSLKTQEKSSPLPQSSRTKNYEINYVAIAVLGIPLTGTFGAILMGLPLQWYTFLIAFFFYLFNGMIGITVGYHRLFSHRSYTASRIWEWICAFAGAGAFEGSAKWWGRNHRIHHRYVDTEKDPYNAKRGFIYSHIGWMLIKQNYSLLGKVDVTDFKFNYVIQFQHRHFFKLAMISGVLLPTFICGLGWGDWMGGFFYASLAKIVIVHHNTFFINSLAHTSLFGAKQNHSDRHSSHDSFVCALLTFGEGYHNFHHEFANDYRNGIRWYHYDPTKWVIRAASFLNLVSNLIRTPNDVIERNYNQIALKMAMKKMEQAQKRLEQLEIPVIEAWTWEDFQEEVAKGRKLTVINGDIIDIMRSVPTGSGYTHSNTDMIWYTLHPGGQRILDFFIGKDATAAFSGGVHTHSMGAENYIPYLRVARLKLNGE